MPFFISDFNQNVTKTIIVTTNKLNLGQYNCHIANDRSGNLSENLIKEKFKVLFKDKK